MRHDEIFISPGKSGILCYAGTQYSTNRLLFPVKPYQQPCARRTLTHPKNTQFPLAVLSNILFFNY